MMARETVSLPFGQRLGEAARGARALLVHTLAGEAATFETWVVLNMLTTRGHPLRRVAIERELAAGLQTSVGEVAGAIDQLAANGLIRVSPADDGNSEVALTATGQEEYGRLRDAVNATTARLLGDLDPGEVQSAARVLTQVKERADSLLAS